MGEKQGGLREKATEQEDSDSLSCRAGLLFAICCVVHAVCLSSESLAVEGGEEEVGWNVGEAEGGG